MKNIIKNFLEHSFFLPKLRLNKDKDEITFSLKAIKLTKENIKILSKKYKFKYEILNNHLFITSNKNISYSLSFSQPIYLLILDNELIDIITGIVWKR